MDRIIGTAVNSRDLKNAEREKKKDSSTRPIAIASRLTEWSSGATRRISMRLHRFQLDPELRVATRPCIKFCQLLPFDGGGKMRSRENNQFCNYCNIIISGDLLEIEMTTFCKRREIKFNYWKYLDDEIKTLWNRWEGCVSRAMCVKFRNWLLLRVIIQQTFLWERAAEKERRREKKTRDERNVGKEESNKRNQGKSLKSAPSAHLSTATWRILVIIRVLQKNEIYTLSLYEIISLPSVSRFLPSPRLRRNARITLAAATAIANLSEPIRI